MKLLRSLVVLFIEICCDVALLVWVLCGIATVITIVNSPLNHTPGYVVGLALGAGFTIMLGFLQCALIRRGESGRIPSLLVKLGVIALLDVLWAKQLFGTPLLAVEYSDAVFGFATAAPILAFVLGHEESHFKAGPNFGFSFFFSRTRSSAQDGAQ